MNRRGRREPQRRECRSGQRAIRCLQGIRYLAVVVGAREMYGFEICCELDSRVKLATTSKATITEYSSGLGPSPASVISASLSLMDFIFLFLPDELIGSFPSGFPVKGGPLVDPAYSLIPSFF